MVKPKGELSDTTLKTYQSVINGIKKEIGLPRDDDSGGRWIVSNWQKILKVIEGSSSIHTKKNRAAVLAVWCDMYDLPDKYGQQLQLIMAQYGNEVTDQYSTNKMTEKQEANWVTIDELREIVKKLEMKLPRLIDTYGEYKQLISYLIILIHLDYPLRNDLACAKIHLAKDMPDKQDKEINYLSVGEKKVTLYLNDYKTEDKYGSKIIEFNEEVSREIMKYYPVIKQLSPKGWFVRDRDDDDKCISRTTLTKWINSAFSDTGKKVSTTQIRRSVISSVYKPQEGEQKKKQDLAYVAGHSTQMAGSVYAKIEPSKK
jgi:hypothetical protein